MCWSCDCHVTVMCWSCCYLFHYLQEKRRSQVLMRKLNRSEQKPTLIAQKKDMFNVSNDEYYNPKLSELLCDTVASCVLTLIDRVATHISPPPMSPYPAMQRPRPVWLTWKGHLPSILSLPPGSTPCGSPPTTRDICCVTSTAPSSRASPPQRSPPDLSLSSTWSSTWLTSTRCEGAGSLSLSLSSVVGRGRGRGTCC